MNFNLYLFGKNKGTYNQYPNDYTSSILSSFCADVTSSKAMIVRDQNLMHYIFAENLGESNVIGVCLIFNKAYITHISKIFNFILGIIESTLLKQGKIIRYNNHGDIEFTTTNLSDDVKAYDYVKTLIDSKLDSDNNYFGVTELTTTYNGLHNSEVIDGNTANSEILKLQQTFNKITIDYKKGIEEDLTKEVIAGLQSQISNLNKKIESKTQEISKLEKAKKQYKKVMFLFIILLCCCGGLYFLYDTLDETERNLQETTDLLNTATDSISVLNNTLTEKQNIITSLNNEVRDERMQKEAAQSTVKYIQSNCSFIITGTSCSLLSREYTVWYFTTESGLRDLKFKVIEEKSGRVYTEKSISENLDSGCGSFKVHFNRNFNTSDWYTFEIWYGSKIVGGGRH